jgi:TolB-like protein
VAEFRYKAFISYSHQDETWADWLHAQLEGFEPPSGLPRLSPIFQDKQELAAASGLSASIDAALADAEFLVVVCSPAAVASRWVSAEIERFIHLGRQDQIICLIVDGVPGSPDAECFPAPLQNREPLAADVRAEGHTRNHALLRLIAALLGLQFNDLRKRETSIAVLPFRDLSADGAQQHLCDGLAEALSDELSQLKDLRVISRTSASSFRQSTLTAAQIGEHLDATYVVDGSIQVSASALRVRLQLVDARTDAIKWSAAFNKDLSDIFVLQDEIAAAVASELQQTVQHQARIPATENGEAYQLLLRAKHLATQFNEAALQRSNELLRQALVLEPDYLDAWNGLSANYCTQVGEGYADQSRVAEAKTYAQRVLKIDPHNTEALSGLGWIALRFENDLSAAARYLQRALTHGSRTSHVLNSTGGLLTRMRRLDDAIRIARYVARHDPLNAHAHANLGVYSLFDGRYVQAIDAYNTALEISPGFVGANFAIGFAHLLGGDTQAAMASMQAETDEEFRIKGTAFVCWDQGKVVEFKEALATLIEKWGDVWPSEVAEVYAYAGMADEAFTWMNRDTDQDAGAGWAESVLNPVFQKLYADERWHQFLVKLGLAPEQLANIAFVLPDNDLN